MLWSVIFDKDGVLVDTEEAKIRSYYSVLKRLIPHEIMGWDEYFTWHATTLSGKSRRDVVEGIIQEYPLLVDILVETRKPLEEQWESGDFTAPAYGEAKREIEKGLCEYTSFGNFPPHLLLSIHRLIEYNTIPLEERCSPIQPMLTFLKSLQDNNFSTSLITETELERTQRELSHIKVDIDSFDIVMCKDKCYSKGDEWKSPGKKHEMYSLVKQRLDKCGKYICAVEDTEPGMEAALQAHIPCFLPWAQYDEKAASILEAVCTGSNPGYSLVVGVDFGGTRTKIEFGETLWLCLPCTLEKEDPEEIVGFLKKMCQFSWVKALGISLAATFVPVKGKKDRRILGTASKFKKLSQVENGHVSKIEKLWREMLEIPVFILNDGEAAANGEHKRGGGRGFDHVLMVTLGTSIGVGFIFHSELLKGPYSSRASHIILDPQGDFCFDRSHRGCWRTLARMDALLEMAENMGLPKDPREITKMAQKGDRNAKLFYELYADKIARGIATIVGAVPVECVVVGGGIAQAGDVLFDPLRERLQRGDLLEKNVASVLEIVPAQCKEAALIGAHLYAEEMLEKEAKKSNNKTQKQKG